MGAGCNYRHKETGTKAFWIEIPQDEEYPDESFIFQDTLEDVKTILEEIGYNSHFKKELVMWNGLYEVNLGSTHNGDLLITLEPEPEDHRLYNLGMANHAKAYDKIARQLIKRGYTLWMATGSYSSGEYIPS